MCWIYNTHKKNIENKEQKCKTEKGNKNERTQTKKTKQIYIAHENKPEINRYQKPFTRLQH